jgi:hypothetical protein
MAEITLTKSVLHRAGPKPPDSDGPWILNSVEERTVDTCRALVVVTATGRRALRNRT